MDTRNITIRAVPPNNLAFKVVRNGNPVYGANVTLCNKEVLIPRTHSGVTDIAGIIQFSAYDLTNGDIPPEHVKEIPWLFMANIPDSEFAYWKDNVKFDTGRFNLTTLKEYTKVPTFWVKIQLRDIIGMELFSNLVAELERSALDWAGMEVIEIKGRGTRTVTVYFKPPFHESPVVVEWAAVWFILKVLAVAGAIIAILVILKWSFGEAFAPVVGSIAILGLLLLILIAAPPAVKKIKELRERR